MITSTWDALLSNTQTTQLLHFKAFYYDWPGFSEWNEDICLINHNKVTGCFQIGLCLISYKLMFFSGEGAILLISSAFTRDPIYPSFPHTQSITYSSLKITSHKTLFTNQSPHVIHHSTHCSKYTQLHHHFCTFFSLKEALLESGGVFLHFFPIEVPGGGYWFTLRRSSWCMEP